MGQYEHTHKGRADVAAEFVRLANDRAGYEHGLRLSLEIGSKLGGDTIERLIALAKARDFEPFVLELSKHRGVE